MYSFSDAPGAITRPPRDHRWFWFALRSTSCHVCHAIGRSELGNNAEFWHTRGPKHHKPVVGMLPILANIPKNSTSNKYKKVDKTTTTAPMTKFAVNTNSKKCTDKKHARIKDAAQNDPKGILLVVHEILKKFAIPVSRQQSDFNQRLRHLNIPLFESLRE